MKKSIKYILAIFVLVLSTLVFLPKEKTAYADVDKIATYWLVKDVSGVDEPYRANVAVGDSWGYGKFVLNAENVTLGTSAHNGYRLVGWQITDEAGNELYISKDTNDGNVTNRVVQTNGLTIEYEDGDVTYTLIFTDDNEDGYFEGGSFTISNVAESLTIVAVYDHIYYNVDVTDFDDIVDFTDTKETIGTMDIIGNLVSSESGVNRYSNAFLKNSENIYYVGEVYSNGTKFYTQHNTLESTPTTQIIDISRGAFRLGDNVSATFDIDFDADNILSDSVNVQVNSVALNGTPLTNSGDNRYSTTAHSDYKNTTIIDVNLMITNGGNVLTVEYNDLYVMSLQAKIDSVLIDSTHAEYSLIINSLNVTNAFSKISNDKYFVLENEQAMLTATRTISKVIEGSRYLYYDLVRIVGAGADENELLFAKATNNFTAIIEYESLEYTIDFKAMLKQATGYTTLTGFNLENSFTLGRGDSETIVKTNVSDNVGYDFYGFAYNTFGADENTSINVTIDNEKPVGYTILMIYTEKDYSLSLSNFDFISLTNGADTIYPITEISLSVNSDKYTINGDDLRSIIAVGGVKTTIFNDAVININDIIDISITLNDGFNIVGYKLGASLDYLTQSPALNQQITKQILESVTGDTIELVIEEAYTTYSLEYYIDATKDSNFDYSVIMADIDIDISSYAYASKEYEYHYTPYSYDADDWTANYNKYYIEISDGEYTLNTNAEYNGSTQYYVAYVNKIIIDGLHLYDSLNVESKPFGVYDTAKGYDYSYKFIGYTTDNMTYTAYTKDINPSDDTDVTYIYNMAITMDDIRVKVVYSMPNTRLLVNVSQVGAYDLSNLIVFEDGNELPINEGYYSIETGTTIIVKLSDSNENVIAFGYKLIGYTLTIDEVPTTSTEANLEYEFTVTHADIHCLTINFELVEYRIEVIQNGAGKTDEKVNFVNGAVMNDYLVATVEGVVIQFTMPEGYYAGRVSLVLGAGEVERTDFANDNDYMNNVYSLELNSTNITTLLRTYAKLIEIADDSYYLVSMKVDYIIHTFDITINFVISDAKGNDSDLNIVTPSFNLNYTFDGATFTIAGRLNNRVIDFLNIPYGIVANISLTNSIMQGMQYDGWYFDSGASLGSAYRCTTSSITAPALTQDLGLMYKWNYIAYTIKVEIANEDDTISMGEPYIYVNSKINASNKAQNTITIYDSFEIYSNAFKANGFIFKTFYYYTTAYVPYTYDEADWAVNYATYYVKSGNNYTLNSNATYNPETTYYCYYDNYRVDYNENNYFKSTFDIRQFNLTGNAVIIYVEYKEFEITIATNASLYGDYTLQIGDLDIAPNDYAGFTVIATDISTKESRELTEGMTATYKDEISVTLTFNKVTLDGNEYSLANGVNVVSIQFFDDYFSIKPDADNNISISFKISHYLSDISDDGVATINYTYKISSVSIKMTTNIEDKSFYDGDKFYTSYDNTTYRFGAVGKSNGEVSLTNKSQYLTKTILNYSKRDNKLIHSDYANYFYIGDVKIYDGLNKSKEITNYADYGVSIYYTTANIEGKNVEIIDYIEVRMVSNLYVEYQLSVLLYFNDRATVDESGAIIFERNYLCDANTNGIEQKLTLGSSVDNDIRASSIIINYLNEAEYYLIEELGVSNLSSNPKDVGRYLVKLSFKEDSTRTWLNSIKLNYIIYLDIVPKEVSITYMNPTAMYEKTYDGNANFSDLSLLGLLMITDNANLNLLISNSDFAVLSGQGGYSISITDSTSEGEKSAVSARDVAYNLYWTNIALDNSIPFNKNFKLNTTELLMRSVIKINRAPLRVVGLEVRDKVYDGTAKVYVKQDADISLTGIIIDNEVSLIVDNIELKYINTAVGKDKQVSVNADKALIGSGASNYYIDNMQFTSTIYPYSITANVEGVGEIRLENRAGLNEGINVDAIPIGARLNVATIYKDTTEYAGIYEYISRFVNSDNIFAIGYNLTFVTNGITSNVSNNLHLIVPNVNRLTGAVFLTGEQAGELNYAVEDGSIVIDLSQMDLKVSNVIFTQQRVLFALWQIILIVVLAVVAVTAIVITVIVIKKKHDAKYSIHDKI